jgi:hypothetical protein
MITAITAGFRYGVALDLDGMLWGISGGSGNIWGELGRGAIGYILYSILI